MFRAVSRRQGSGLCRPRSRAGSSVLSADVKALQVDKPYCGHHGRQ